MTKRLAQPVSSCDWPWTNEADRSQTLRLRKAAEVLQSQRPVVVRESADPKARVPANRRSVFLSFNRTVQVEDLTTLCLGMLGLGLAKPCADTGVTGLMVNGLAERTRKRNVALYRADRLWQATTAAARKEEASRKILGVINKLATKVSGPTQRNCVEVQKYL